MPYRERKIDDLIEGWINYQTFCETDRSHEFEWASDEVLDLIYDPDALWNFIEKSYARIYGTDLEAVYAAGVLEDFVRHFGKTHLERVRAKAERDPKFRHLLGGVWRQGTPINVWREFEKIRGEEW